MLIDRARIRELIPHAGSMCLLDAALSWDDDHIHCTATSHLDPSNPLRGPWGLHSICGLEYAAQAMALHGALTAGAQRRSRGGLLASARDIVLYRPQLHSCGPELAVHATRLLGEDSRVIYGFRVDDRDGAIIEGRAAVVLEA